MPRSRRSSPALWAPHVALTNCYATSADYEGHGGTLMAPSPAVNVADCPFCDILKRASRIC